MIFVIGEVLFDIFPAYKRIGGAPFNFAFHMKQMGFPVDFVTRVGDDANGREILDIMKEAGFSMTDVQIDDSRETGKVMVQLDDKGVPTFDIVQDVAYDHIAYTDVMGRRLTARPSLLYTGTLVQRHEKSRQTLRDVFLAKPADVPFFYDVNLRPHCYTSEAVQDSLRAADILKLNAEELEVLADMFGVSGHAHKIVNGFMERWGLSMVALTKGIDGSELFTPDDYASTGVPEGYDCIDTVGAGDAFAAVIAVGYLKGRPLGATLTAASDFAARMCEIQGAVPEGTEIYNALNKGFLPS
ncbi:MAG: carbohydrate kinase [Thermodesulfobacteriota bacterium]|nr:carbohydrate kinase [Thermodesulfobacteriota bacterium]